MKRRANILIYMEILAFLREESRGPTRLAQSVNLSYDKFVPYLRNLEQKGLVRMETRDKKEVCVVTQEGNQLFLDWQKVWEKLR